LPSHGEKTWQQQEWLSQEIPVLKVDRRPHGSAKRVVVNYEKNKILGLKKGRTGVRKHRLPLAQEPLRSNNAIIRENSNYLG